jgi:hypothetical protein
MNEISAGRELEHLDRDVQGSADPAAAVAYASRIGLGIGNEFRKRVCRNGRIDRVSSIGQCNTSCSLLAGVSKAKVFRGR